MKRKAGSALLGVLALLAACRPAPSNPLPPPPPPPPSTVASAKPAPPPAADHRRATDPRWLDARSDDPLEKARLAVAVGAAELMAGIDDGGETAETALASLPFADDGEVALGKLAEMARTDAGRRRKALSAILGIAGQPRRQREPLDLDGARHCGEVLLTLAADKSLPREERALAVSAARALAEKGYVERGRISSDLDPAGK